MLQHIGIVATPKPVPRNYLRYLQTTLIMGGGGGLVSEFMWRMQYANKKVMKTFSIFRFFRYILFINNENLSFFLILKEKMTRF